MKPELSIISICLIMYVLSACNQNGSVPGKEDGTMHVKIVSLEKCGATQPTIALVKETARELDISIDFAHVVVKTTEEAKEHRHIGSPTVQINGVDIDPPARNITQYGIT